VTEPKTWQWAADLDNARAAVFVSIDARTDAALRAAATQAVATRAAWDLRQQHYTRSIGQVLRHVRRRVNVRVER